MAIVLWKPTDLSWARLAERVWHRCREHRLLDHSASLSFYFLLAIFPMLALAMSVAGSLIQSAPDSRAALRSTLEQILPRSALGVIDSTLAEIQLGRGGLALWAGGLVACWSAVRGTRALVLRLNVAYGTVGRRSRLRRALLSAGLTLVMLVALVATSILWVYGGRLGDRFSSDPLLGDWLSPTSWVLSRGALLLLAMLIFGLLYAYAPSVAGRRRAWLTLGAVVGVAVWVAASIGLRMWLRHFRDYTLAYGSIGAVIVLQLWFYLSATALLLGAEVNAEIESAPQE